MVKVLFPSWVLTNNVTHIILLISMNERTILNLILPQFVLLRLSEKESYFLLRLLYLGTGAFSSFLE